MAEFRHISALERAAAAIATLYNDGGDGTHRAELETNNGSDTIPAGGSPNHSSEGASADAMGPVCQLKNIEPCTTYVDNDDDDFVYPTDEDVDRYDAASKTHNNAVQAHHLADNHSTMCWREKNKRDRQLRSLEQTARRSKVEAEEVRASIPLLDEATRECERMLACIREVHPKACSNLVRKQAALARAETGREIDGKRKRSTARNHPIVASKSVKVGALAAGKAARSGRPSSVSIPAVLEPEDEEEKRLDKFRVAVETAEKDVMDAKASIDKVLQLLKDHRSQAEGERTRVELLTRAAEDDAQALHVFSVSSYYREACEAYHNAGVRLEEAKTAVIRTEGDLRAAEVVFREAFATGKWVSAPSDRVQMAMGKIASKDVKPCTGGEKYPRYDNLIIPRPTGNVRLPFLEGIDATSESKMGIKIAEAVGEWKRAKARRQAQDIKMGVIIAEEEEEEEDGNQERVTVRRQAKKAAPAAGGATVRRSSRSTRGKPAEVYES